MERILEHGIFASRWLLAPFYVGLIATLLVMLYSFFAELVHLVQHASTLQATDIILASLSLIDISLAANLVIIVAFSGYENFVSKIDVGNHEDQPSWKGKVDFTGLKIKLISSIIAISGIHLLKIFMDISKYNERDIYWMVVIHVVFVASGVCLAFIDTLIAKAKTLNGKK
jgi:uncharacterized protein (TIGR00645 family)